MSIDAIELDGKKYWLRNEVERLCSRARWCQASRRGGDLDADLDALEEQRALVERLLVKLMEASADRPPQECSICRGRHGREIVHACE